MDIHCKFIMGNTHTEKDGFQCIEQGPSTLYYDSHLTLSQSFKPMAAQLSMKATLPLLWQCHIAIAIQGPGGELASLLWCHNGGSSVSNHQPHDCLLNHLFRCRTQKTSKLRVTGLCAGNSPATGEFPAQMACNVENVSIWWCHYVCCWHGQ